MCIHKYNPDWDNCGNPCIDGLYCRMEEARTPEELYGFIQNRIEYLKTLVSYAESMGS